MPLPDGAEQAANRIQKLMERFDIELADYMTGRTSSLPSVRSVTGEASRLAELSVIHAFRDVDITPTSTMVAAAVAEIMGPVRDMVRAAVAEAERGRKRTHRPQPGDTDDGAPAAVLVRRVGRAAAFPILLARAVTGRRKPDPLTVRRVARQVGVPVPKPTAAYVKMVVRTETARQRNKVVADVVEARVGQGERWAVYVRDGMNGPTDHACERVDKRWATPVWLRNHLVEHPNCTRMGRPRLLPPGERITLLR